MKIIASILVLLFSVSASFACMCSYIKDASDVEHSRYLKKAEAIFHGEIISIGDRQVIERKYRGGMTSTEIYQPVKFKVLRAWKGVEEAQITVRADTESSCGFSPRLGSRITVYAYKNKDLKISLGINQCSINETEFDEEKMIHEYGAGKVFEQPPIEQPPIEPPRQTEITEGFWSGVWRKLASFFS